MNFRAEVYNEKQLEQALNNLNIEKVYAPYHLISNKFSYYSDKIILVPPVFLGDCEEKVRKSLLSLKEIGFENALAHTIGHIEMLRSIGFIIFGGYRLNCVNSDTIAFFTENGVADIIVSPEMTASQINNLYAEEIGFIAYGHLPLMITRRCPLKNGAPCNKKCCNRTIVDRKGNRLNIICSENTAEILNSDVLYLADKLESFVNTDFAVLKFTVEQNVDEIIDLYANASSAKAKKFTRGLYFRGIKE